VNASSDPQLHESRPSFRMDARLDATTRQKVDDLATRFHQPRAAILCHVMQWGLNHNPIEPLDQGDAQGPVRHLSLYVSFELHARVQKTAIAAGVNMAPWLRHMVRQISEADFPASWQGATPDVRSHNSRTYGARFMLRLDGASRIKVQSLAENFGVSKAEVIRQLIEQVHDGDFPLSWRMRAAERRAQQNLPHGMGKNRELNA
jgi:hypothetical protein